MFYSNKSVNRFVLEEIIVITMVMRWDVFSK